MLSNMPRRILIKSEEKANDLLAPWEPMIRLDYIREWARLVKDTAGLIRKSVEKGKFYYVVIGEAFDIYKQAKKKITSTFGGLVERII